MQVKVIIVSENSRFALKAEEGMSLLQLFNEKNIGIISPCGGSGVCGKCKVKINKNDEKLSETELIFLTNKEIEKGYRLACCTKVTDGMEIELLKEGKIQVVTEGIDIKVKFNPQLTIHNLHKDESTRDNSLSHLDLLYKSSSTKYIDFSTLRKIPGFIDQENLSLLSYKDKIINIAKKPIKKVYGLAVDIGTTTVAAYLMDLLTGEEIAVDSFHNPQKKYGADVISRINHIQGKNGKHKELQEILIEELNNCIERLVLENNIKTSDIYLMTTVGNTVMTHLLIGIDPYSLANAPYRPILTDTVEISPDELGLIINPQGVIQILPAVSAYIGADIIADLLVTDFSSKRWNLIIDVGTNGEIVLANNRQMLACSAAAGPAFEGANITFGMAGVPGAVSSFNIFNNGHFDYQTINNEQAIGICGSGLIDIIGEAVENNIVTKTGVFNEDIDNNIISNIVSYKNMKALKIVDRESAAIDSPILLTQKDVREVQLAKGAIAAGINILIKEAGISYKDIENIFLAGGFGSFINPTNACKIGLLPKNMEDKIIKIGNGAGLGAKNYILDKRKREEAEFIAKSIDYIELSLRKDFQDEFMKSMEF